MTTDNFHIFVLPFTAGMAFVILYVLAQISALAYRMPRADKRAALKGIFSIATFRALGEIFCEVLLHCRIWRENKRLGFMHFSFAFGWFMLIVTGWAESYVATGGEQRPVWEHIFAKYFAPGEHYFAGSAIFENLMDLWLALILSGQAIAILKRFAPRKAGIAIRTRHSRFNRIAMSALWFIFPLRLAAESVATSINGGGGFLTGTLGNAIAAIGDASALYMPLWWAYSLALGTFFVAIPFSRYLHIPVEAFLILARHWRITDAATINKLETMACSACGMCLSDCPLARTNIAAIQPVYFIERLRDHAHTDDDKWKCLQCGRCQQICPVKVHSTALRQQLKGAADVVAPQRPSDNNTMPRRVTLFAGCMGKLTPRTQMAMNRILEAAHIEYTWVDNDRDLCCGRPLKFNADDNGAQQKLNELTSAIAETRPNMVVTTCPICYNMINGRCDATPVMHHTNFVKMLVDNKAITLRRNTEAITYHDPCELSRIAGITSQPVAVLSAIANLKLPAENGAATRCCGGSLAATTLSGAERTTLADDLAQHLTQTAASTIVTACPLCKKTIAQRTATTVRDFAEVVADAIE